MKKIIIAPLSGNPITVDVDDWTIDVFKGDVIHLHPIIGQFEVREVITKGKNTIYHVMPIP